MALPGLACDRLQQPPRPNGVPEGAIRDRNTRLWVHRTADNRLNYYHSDGARARTGQLASGTTSREGVWRAYASDGERLTSVGAYLNNWRDQEWRYFDDAEQLYLTVEYQPEPKRFFGFLGITDYGNENGPFERYFPDGSLEERGVFWSGYYHGPITRFHRSGRKALEGRYEKDLPVGIWRYYYPEGGLEREERYLNGQLDGPLRNYHPDGSLYHETVFAAGKEIGPKRIFPRR